jgi:hypothetical protein
MLEHSDQQSLTNQFIAPALDALQNCEFTRRCPGLSDEQWTRMGIERALKECKTGRGFLQEWAMANSEEFAVEVSHFFETLKSARRLKLIAQINRVVAAAMPTHPDCQIDELEDLAGVDIYAGDGHYHKTSTHELPIKGKKRAVGHFYTLNMRTHALTHLTGADHEAGRKKSEHDMHALKRMSTEQLRQSAATGRQVLYVWDKAGIDIPQWYRWKQSAGIYFLSCSKELFKLTFYGENDFDRGDPVNRGILEDQMVTNATSQVTFRYIKYQCPDTGAIYEFVTNHMKIRPGVLAWLYKRRWDIEKTYDTLKNKMEESKAWALTSNAKEMQAQFICLAHNLMVLMEQRMATEHGLRNEKEIRRCAKREKIAEQRAQDGGRRFAPIYLNPIKRSQLTLKFIRWLRYHIQAESSMTCAIRSLQRIYAMF